MIFDPDNTPAGPFDPKPSPADLPPWDMLADLLQWLRRVAALFRSKEPTP